MEIAICVKHLYPALLYYFFFFFFFDENYDFWFIKLKRELKENKGKDAGALEMIQIGVLETIFLRIMGTIRTKEAIQIKQGLTTLGIWAL